MSNNIQPFRGTPPAVSLRSPRLARQVERNLDYLDADTTYQLAKIDSIVEVQQEQVRAINSIGTTAMIATAQLAQAEVSLAQLAPHASGRLAAIADLTALQTAELVVDSAQKIRRAGR